MTADAATWYNRTDGGTSTQCLGTTNAAYDGSGTGEACAFIHPNYAWGFYTDAPTGGTAGAMSGGDTVDLRSGDDFKIGYDAAWSGCNTAWAYGCTPRPIPSGSAGTHTVIRGSSYASCASVADTAQLWGTQRAGYIVDLAGNDYIDFKCLEITDHATCIGSLQGNASANISCERSSYPFGDHADNGIQSKTGAPTNITLDHVYIHGLVRGVFASKKGDWTVTDSEISLNYSVAWDNDVEGDSATTANNDTGTITLTRVLMQYSGCGEVWDSPGTPFYCYSQDQSGYGDTYTTGGGNSANVVVTDSEFNYNVSDAFDNLYSDGTVDILDIRNTSFQGNAGQVVKSSANITRLENIFVGGNCGWFRDKAFTAYANEQSGRSGSSCTVNGVCAIGENSTNCAADCPAFNNCRAAGTPIVFTNKVNGQDFYTYNSTVYSNGDVVFTLTGANVCSGTTYVVKNTVAVSGIEFNDGTDKADFYYSDGSGNCADGTFAITEANNTIINSKAGAADCGGSSTCTTSTTGFVGTIPLNTSYYTGEDFAAAFYRTSASDDADETISCQGDCSVDYNHFDRGASWDRGAFEYGSVPSEGGGGGSGTPNSLGGVRLTMGGVRIRF